jgi:hypothetical protein
MAVDGCTSTFYCFLFCVCTLETYVTLEILRCMSLLHLSLLFLVAPAIQEALFFCFGNEGSIFLYTEWYSLHRNVMVL